MGQLGLHLSPYTTVEELLEGRRATGMEEVDTFTPQQDAFRDIQDRTEETAEKYSVL